MILYRHLNAPLTRPRYQQHLEREQPAQQADSEGFSSWSTSSYKKRKEEWEGERYDQRWGIGSGDQKCSQDVVSNDSHFDGLTPSRLLKANSQEQARESNHNTSPVARNETCNLSARHKWKWKWKWKREPCHFSFVGRLIIGRDYPVLFAEHERMGKERSGLLQLPKQFDKPRGVTTEFAIFLRR